jgi:ribulose-5-phosphate 4-epimerase/fuculose-1-phosphate aldolase
VTAAADVDVGALRLHRKQRLAAAVRIFARLGFDEGTAGHLSARDPERPDHFWINPLAVPFAHVRVRDLVLVDPHGAVVEGDGRVSRAGYFIHSTIYDARADIDSVVHAHSIYGKAWSAFARLLDPINQEACIFYGRHCVYADFHGAVKDDSEGRGIAAALGPTNTAAILRNHGLLTVGASVDEAAYRFVIMDRSCQVQLLAEAAGTPCLVDHDIAIELAAEDAAYCTWCFEPLWTEMVRAQPDLLD